MARVAIVSYDVQTIFGKAGGMGTFTTRWADLLRSAGEAVTIVMTRADPEPACVDPQWRTRYQEKKISLIELQASPASPMRRPEVATMRLSEIAAPVLRGFDIAYFQDWGNPAFHLARERRYSLDPGPVCVTVLHGPSEWNLSSNGKYPELPGDLHLAYQERYAAKHSDFVISPSRFMAEHLLDLGWEFPRNVEVLGWPMPEQESAPQDFPLAQIRKIVYFGRVEERKGIRNFVTALQKFGKTPSHKPAIVLLGAAEDRDLLQASMRGIKEAGFAVSHEGFLDSDRAQNLLRKTARETLCVIPSVCDNYPYTVVEASLIPGLNVIACRNGGVHEILPGAAGQLCGPLPQDLADKIAQRVKSPLASSDLAHYDCLAANARWREFHQKAVLFGQTRTRRAAPKQKLTVDVCVNCYQKTGNLSQLVDALVQQTETDFHVIAVNDGSPDEASRRAFAEQAARTAGRGWDFYCEENAFLDAARNSAARRGTGDLILFVDSDDVPARTAIARMREAISLSGDDALICASYGFAGENKPFDPATGEVLVMAQAICIPLGIDLVGGLLNPPVFGGTMPIISRSVFEKIGGFRELKSAGHEGREFYARLAVAGYRVDVLPELLQYCRQVDGTVTSTLSSESAKRRLIDVYEDSLAEWGLEGAALALAGLYRNSQELEGKIRQLSIKAAYPRTRYAFFSGSANRFEDTGLIARLRDQYRRWLPLGTRLKIHKLFLSPFVGPYSTADDMQVASSTYVRGAVFCTTDGFAEIRGVGFEGYEFRIRCNSEELRWEVSPELGYRMLRTASVSISKPGCVDLAPVRGCFEERLRTSGLRQLPLAVGAAFWRHNGANDTAARLRVRIAANLPKRPVSSQRLQLLLLTPYFPFGASSGWHWRVQQIIRYFGSRYDLTLVAPMASEEEELRTAKRQTFRYLRSVRGVEWGLPLSSLGDDLPFRVRQCYTNTMQAALRALPTEQYHAVLIDQIFMAEFRHDIETVSVLIEHNIESRLLWQAAERSGRAPLTEAFQDPLAEAERLERYEDRTWPDFNLRAVCSEVDRLQMDSRAKSGRTVVAPNGAHPSSWVNKARQNSGVALFAAHLSYFPNVDAIEFLVAEIWPEVRSRKPGARLILAGREPADAVKAAAAAAPGVEIRANPKSMDRVARDASITIVPLRLGSGTRHKILESMAWGLPVVSTTLGCEGIDAADGEHLLIRDDPKEFAEAMVWLMSDAALWQKLRNAGRELVRERYSWDRVFQPLEKALLELVS